MMELSSAAAIQKFCDVWQTEIASVLKSLGVTDVTASWSTPLADAASPSERTETVVERSFQAQGSLSGALVWSCEASVAVQFAQLLQSEALDPAAEFSELQRDAYAEFLRQVSGQVATAWKQETGSELQLALEAAVPPRLPGTLGITLQLKSEKFPELSLQMLLDAALCAALNAPPETPAEVAAAPAEAVIVPDVDEPLAEGLPANLALLLDVELEATIRFGQRDMLLREVFGLMPGAVVELNQSVNEPAELLVAGRLIARGEVVVVDGNFGLRVTEVASAGQRAALLDL
jgi:flagellar motor switch protein FliN